MDATPAIGFACTGFVGFFALLFGFLALQRWLRHRETMAMIQQGIKPPPQAKWGNGNGKTLLVWGIGIATFGLIMMAALGAAWMLMLRVQSTSVNISLPLLALPGLAVLFMGGAVLLVYVLLKPVRGNGASSTVGFEAKVEE
jgi:hypothetical protein